MATEKKVKIWIKDRIPLIWTAEDAITLRDEHHIVGRLIGSMPNYVQQNVSLSLPLQLLPEEATLLREKGIAELLDANAAVSLPTSQDAEEFKKQREASYEEQVVAFKEVRKKELLLHADQIKEGRKLRRQRKAEKRKASGLDTSAEDDVKQSSEEEFDVDKVTIPDIPRKFMLIQTMLEPVKERPEVPAEWTFPETEVEKIRLRVFKDLWEKKLYVTNGGKFGGDFLAYPGDPLLFHAFYIVTCLPFHQKLTALDLVAHGRMASITKKTALLSSVDDNDCVLLDSRTCSEDYRYQETPFLKRPNFML